MRIKTVIMGMVCCTAFFVSASFCAEIKQQSKPVTEAQGASENQSIAAPLAVLSDGRFEFPSVLEGADAVHTFTIQNKGTAPLKIEKVKTG